VVIFFVLSGFLITGSLWDAIDEKSLLRNFFIRRALRILPLYFLALLISFLGALAHGLTFATFKAFLIYVFFLQDLPVLADWALKYNSPYPLYHLWSLAVEEQFYLLWPLLLLGADNRRGARNICLRIVAFSAFFRLIFSLPDLNFGRHGLYDDFVLTHAGALALGGAVALALRSRDRSTGRIASPVRFLRRYAAPAFYSGLLLFIAIGIFRKTRLWPTSFLIKEPLQFMFGLLGVSVAAAALIAIVLRPGRPRKVFSYPWLGYLGRISYGFYIFHILLQPWFDYLGGRLMIYPSRLFHMNYWSGDLYQFCRMVAAFVITLGVSMVSYQLLELPMMRLGRRFPMPSPLPSGLHLLSSTRRDPNRSTTPSQDIIPAARENRPPLR
jgi:peptidoglycan/LPS O-acetylase OafA/YrhL